MFIEKSKEVTCRSQPLTPRGREKGQNITRSNIQTTAPDAHRPNRSSPSEVITMLNRTKQHENKEEGKTQHETSSNKTHKAI